MCNKKTRIACIVEEEEEINNNVHTIAHKQSIKYSIYGCESNFNDRAKDTPINVKIIITF